MKIVDFRSDTVTWPTSEMRSAMSTAEVGDDVYGEDPSVNRLQEIAAAKLGKEAGLFVPSGTMGNLISVLSYCARGDECIMGNLGHTFLFEAGGISALGGVHPHTLLNQEDGTLLLDEIRAAIRPENDHFPHSRLVILENTHNRCGGVPISGAYTQQVAEIAHENGLYMHLDGARIFNAAAALNAPVRSLTDPADSVTFCLSKGLCAPVGSVICGSREFIRKARRIRKQLGGGMRQAGILAAAGIVALDKMVDRLGEDHQRAKSLACGLAQIPGILVDKKSPASNMVFLSLDKDFGLSAKIVAAKMAQLGVLVGEIGERQFRLVTHYWIDDQAVGTCIAAFRTVLSS